MTQIAIYGKGGIGKSTVSANLSAALAIRGKRVLQIGCDPKHDSTRLLLGGTTIPTVLNYLSTTLPARRALDDLVFEGYGGVACVEAGGPEPGVGCAGRGILTTFEILDELGIRDIPFDIVLYDVLGDVVCGGFAVPLRKQYADVVFLVTSGEYMALYATNNILRGIRNLGESAPTVAGLIHNGRGMEHENCSVLSFSKAVQLPVIASIPRSEYFATAEKEGGTLAELYPHSKPAQIFAELAGYVEKLSKGSVVRYTAKPLEDNKLEELVLGRVAGTKTRLSSVLSKNTGIKSEWRHLGQPPRKSFYTKSVMNKQPLRGCSFAGAVAATSQVTDSLTIAHGPRSCAHIVSNFLNNALLNAAFRYGSPLPEQQRPVFLSTDMDDNTFIFGGTQELVSYIDIAVREEWKYLFIVTTCPSGLIGDNIEHAISMVKDRYPDVNILFIPTDGNLAGDFSQGFIEGCRKALCLVDTSVRKECGTVNIVGEQILSDNFYLNYRTICSLLNEIGFSVNCRFLASTTSDKLINFKRAELNLLAYDDESGKVLKDLLEAEVGARFFGLPFPVGFAETAKWLEKLAKISGKEKEAAAIIDSERAFYEAEITRLQPLLNGKTVLISAFNLNLDWIFDTILDMGMKVAKVGLVISPSAGDFRSCYTGTFPIEYDYTAEKRMEDIKELEPDLVLSNHLPVMASYEVHHDVIPFSPDVGFKTGLIMAQKWGRLFRLPVVEGWKRIGEKL